MGIGEQAAFYFALHLVYLARTRHEACKTFECTKNLLDTLRIAWLELTQTIKEEMESNTETLDCLVATYLVANLKGSFMPRDPFFIAKNDLRFRSIVIYVLVSEFILPAHRYRCS